MSASAMESVAIFQNRKVDAGTREEIIQSLKEAYLAAEANWELTEKSLKRSEKLFEEGIITPQKMDEVTALNKSALAAKEAAKYQYEMALSGARIEDIESARAMVDAAKGSVYGFESLLADSRLTALAEGEIGSVFVSEGELVLPGSSLMNIINTDSCYVVLNVREDYISQFYIGSEFIGTVPAFGYASLAFEVYYMNPLGSFANWSQTKGGNTYDLVTFQIKARPIKVIDTQANNNLIKDLRPGMTVLVELDEI
ncbi:MAG: HlyD family secretion protein [Bacteroidales bacterium]|nr:HlyD family secretion protein [Bacteroidales bacterium]